MTTPIFKPRFDIHQAMLDRFQLLMNRQMGLVDGTPRDGREAALEQLKAQARGEIDALAREDITAQEIEHAKEQIQRVSAIDVMLSELPAQADALLAAFDAARKASEGVTDETQRRAIGLRLGTLIVEWRRGFGAR